MRRKLPNFAYQLQGDKADDNFVIIGENDQSSWPKKVLSGLLKNFYTTSPLFQNMKQLLSSSNVAIGIDNPEDSPLNLGNNSGNDGVYIAETGCIIIRKDLVTMESMKSPKNLINLLTILPHEMTHATHDIKNLFSINMDRLDYIQNEMATEAAAYTNTIMAHWYLSHNEPMVKQIPALKKIWDSIKKMGEDKLPPYLAAMHEARMIFGTHANKNGNISDLKYAWKDTFKNLFCENEYFPIVYLERTDQKYSHIQKTLTNEFNNQQKISFTAARLGQFMALPGFDMTADKAELEEMIVENKALLSQNRYRSLIHLKL